MVNIKEERKVFVAWSNTDLTEGRGFAYPLHICWSETTAKRLGKGKSVQGSDCRVTEEIALRIDGKWYAPARIEHPSKEDKKKDAEMFRLKKVQEEKDKAIEKAKSLGLSDADIEALRS